MVLMVTVLNMPSEAHLKDWHTHTHLPLCGTSLLSWTPGGVNHALGREAETLWNVHTELATAISGISTQGWKKTGRTSKSLITQTDSSETSVPSRRDVKWQKSSFIQLYDLVKQWVTRMFINKGLFDLIRKEHERLKRLIMAILKHTLLTKCFQKKKKH